MKLKLILIMAAVGAMAQGDDHCANIPDSQKVDCAPNEGACAAANCCWDPREPGSITPWCFFPDNVATLPPNGCDALTWTADGQPIDDAMYAVMYAKYAANLNVEGCGAVVAAPDNDTPGGDYYYHWMRDAGLSIKAWMDINDNEYDVVREALDGYAAWVGKVQQMPDANNDVRIEPKFYIPSGKPYDGGWCRPQTDGPALRAMALSRYGMLLLAAGQGDPKNDLWPLVKYDMEWVTENWAQNGCDLWEEVRSENFYWNRMAFVYSLNQAADFADLIGETAMVTTYRKVAEEIGETAKEHWRAGEGYIYESQNRPYDGAVIHAIATFGEYLFAPDSQEAASTIAFLAEKFCNEYPINQEDNQAGISGILIGRYPGDSYAGGNPWQLLTAVTAEAFYLGAQLTEKKIVDKAAPAVLTLEDHKAWMDLLNLREGSTMADLAEAQLAAGDSIMTRMWNKIGGDGGKVDEQIDKYTGKQTSAEDLTWSYANILHALHTRKQVAPLVRSLRP